MEYNDSSSQSVQQAQSEPRKGWLRVALVRVVVVEDHEQFRRFICSMLGKAPELQVMVRSQTD